MRKRFEQQLELGATPIEAVIFNQSHLKSRDELPPVLMALQHIFITKELNEAVFTLLEKHLFKTKTQKTGRPGMNLWHILVLAVIRHSLGSNWDRVCYIANNDLMVRRIMGIPVDGIGMMCKDQKKESAGEFSYQTIIDNVSQIDAKLLQELNAIVVKYGRQLLKKGEDEIVELKTDSYALETNVYFPNDLRLAWDSVRKCLELISKLCKSSGISSRGWRKIKFLKSTTKGLYRSTSQVLFKGKIQEKKIEAVKVYLDHLSGLFKRIDVFYNDVQVVTSQQLLRKMELAIYKDYLVKFIDQIERRVIKGEQIPAEEKVYSIFEPETEWIAKGKHNPNVELGHRILITTDQHHFILDYKVMLREVDVNQVADLAQRIKPLFSKEKSDSHSFDKGFYSKSNKEILQSCTERVILPKKGKKNLIEKEEESDKQFIALRHKHSAVESNINRLEHHGLNRCFDKGLNGYKRCVGLSVLAYNLHILGNHILEKEKKLRLKPKRLSRAKVA